MRLSNLLEEADANGLTPADMKILSRTFVNVQRAAGSASQCMYRNRDRDNKVTIVNPVSAFTGDLFHTANLVIKNKQGEWTTVILTSLEGFPKHVDGRVICAGNWLTDLNGDLDEVTRSFDVSSNRLTSLEGCPKLSGDHVTLNLFNNNLTSLRNIHKHIPRLDGRIILTSNPIKTHVLGLLLIDGLIEINYDDIFSVESHDKELRRVVEIINRHLTEDRRVSMARVNRCQDELIEADLEDFAEI